ncbi:MAG TPA: hypothetical protein VF127_08570 [Nitrospira sp.]
MSKYTSEEIDNFTAEEFAWALGEAWSTRDGPTFLSLFTPDALVEHPLFSGPTPVGTILFAACQANVSLTEPTDVQIGNGGISLELSFDDFGVQHNLLSEHVGTVRATATMRGRRASLLSVHGFGVRAATDEDRKKFAEAYGGQLPEPRPRRYSSSEIDAMDMESFARALGEAWGGNDAETFISFFSSDALIHHPLFSASSGPLPPRTVVEVLNGSYIGTTVLQRVVEEGGQMVALYDEVPDPYPTPSPVIPTMKVRARMRERRIEELYVDGYTVRHADQSFQPV